MLQRFYKDERGRRHVHDPTLVVFVVLVLAIVVYVFVDVFGRDFAHQLGRGAYQLLEWAQEVSSR